MEIELNQFSTTSTPLATALSTFGVPFCERWRTNEYSEDVLRRIGCRNISEALQRRIPGQITYYFQRPNELDGMLQAYNAQLLAMRDAGFGEDVTEPLDIEPEIGVRLAAVILKNRTVIASNWTDAETIVGVQTGEKSFVLISRNASRNTRERCGV